MMDLGNCCGKGINTLDFEFLGYIEDKVGQVIAFEGGLLVADKKEDIFFTVRVMPVVEFALTLRNSSSEFHKDIFKVLLAVDSGEKVNKLVFISKPGAIKRHSEPASKAITDWLKRKYEIEITIIELK